MLLITSLHITQVSQVTYDKQHEFHQQQKTPNTWLKCYASFSLNFRILHSKLDWNKWT